MAIAVPRVADEQRAAECEFIGRQRVGRGLTWMLSIEQRMGTQK